MLNERIGRRLQLIVVASVTVLFILVTVMSFQLAIMSNRNNEIAALEAEQARLRQALEEAERDIYFYDTWDFIEEWARQNLGMGRPGQSFFVR